MSLLRKQLMAHDYRVMSGRRGFLCMNEIFFGAAIPPGLLASLESKIQSHAIMRKMVLQGHRFSGTEALKLQLVDALALAFPNLVCLRVMTTHAMWDLPDLVRNRFPFQPRARSLTVM